MRFAIIKDGLVDNIILASQEFADSLPFETVNVTDVQCDIGWSYQDGVFEKVAKPIVFTPVRPLAFRIALLQTGLKNLVEEALDQPGMEIPKLGFEYALEFKREDQMVVQLAQHLGLTDKQVDDLFVLAMNIVT